MNILIVHDYENIDLAVLWGTVTKSLPELSKQIDSILYQEVQEIDILSEAEDEEFEMEI